MTGPGPATTCHRSLREPGLLEELRGQQRRQHRLGVGLDDHRVAGDQGGQPVAERHREGVVPGTDDPDDALGDVVDVDPGQHGEEAHAPLGAEVTFGRAAVVAGRQRDVGRLVEGVLAGLARLPHDQVDDLVLAVEHEVVQPQGSLGPLTDGRPGPRLPGRAAPAGTPRRRRPRSTAARAPAAGRSAASDTRPTVPSCAPPAASVPRRTPARRPASRRGGARGRAAR